MELSKEKGSYPTFTGRKWETGAYFSNRNYADEKWLSLAENVKEYGMRNGYLMAVAPNSTTAMIAGSTASIDPVFKSFYSEEKKDFRIPTTAPDLDHHTYEIYRSEERRVGKERKCRCRTKQMKE